MTAHDTSLHGHMLTFCFKMRFSAVVFTAALLAPASAAVRMPSWFADHMVLQTNAEYGARSFLNGKASPAERVQVQFDGSTAFSAVADAAGDWEVEILARPVNAIAVMGESGDAIVANNVTFGDVFFCSGQSNMVFPLDLALNASAEIASVLDPRYSKFRYLSVPLQANTTEQFTTHSPLTWDLPSTTMIAKFSAVCFLTARQIYDLHIKNRPVGLVFSAWGGTRIEAWTPPEALAKCKAYPEPPPAKPAPQWVASSLWNAMVAPFQKMSIRAAFWYQGEANADVNIYKDEAEHTAQYACVLQAMVAAWRDRKGMGDFAFMNMQLPPSVDPAAGAKNPQTGRMAIRAAEAEAVARPAGLTDIAGMAVTIDLGGKSAWGYDHPINKNEMSKRLALQTVHHAYAQQLDTMPLWTGPIHSNVTFTPSDVTVSMEVYSAPGLKTRDVKDCTLCCNGSSPFEVTTDGTHWTKAAIKHFTNTVGAASVTVEGSGATAVRYAWTDFVECVVVNDADLPMGPFAYAKESEPSAAPSLKPVRTLKKDSPIQSPPMGFNSWNFYHCNIDENEIKAIARAMAVNGMRDVGYQYINIDDCWQVGRENETGTIIADPSRFPSGMKAVADYVHRQELKFGVYTARGSRTCQGRPGSYSYELVDAATYCDWGLDYLKNDNCGGANWPALNTSWLRFKQGFEKCYNDTGRYIVSSIEYCKDPSGCGEWIANSANLWRTEGDIQNTWGSVKGNIHGQNDMAHVAKPGHFNDPDMLQIGNVGLTWVEQRTHMAYWCIASAPLLAGTDIVHATNATLAILTAAEYVMVNQDLGVNGAIQGVLQPNLGATGARVVGEVWVKHLSTGSTAVLLVNAGDAGPVDVTIDFSTLGIGSSAKATVRKANSSCCPLLPPAHLYYPIPRGKIPTRGNIWSFTVG